MYPPPKKDYNSLLCEIEDDDRKFSYNELNKYGKFVGDLWILSPEPLKQSVPVSTVDEIVLSKDFLNMKHKKRT